MIFCLALKMSMYLQYTTWKVVCTSLKMILYNLSLRREGIKGWTGDGAHFFKFMALSVITDISNILSDQISLPFNMTMHATLFSCKIYHWITMEHVRASIYFWLDSAVDQVRILKDTEKPRHYFLKTIADNTFV